MLGPREKMCAHRTGDLLLVLICFYRSISPCSCETISKMIAHQRHSSRGEGEPSPSMSGAWRPLPSPPTPCYLRIDERCSLMKLKNRTKLKVKIITKEVNLSSLIYECLPQLQEHNQRLQKKERTYYSIWIKLVYLLLLL